MKVSELISMLQDFDENSEVMIKSESGDYWQSELASTISDVEFGNVEFSDYHRKHKVVEDSDEQKEVVLIG